MHRLTLHGYSIKLFSQQMFLLLHLGTNFEESSHVLQQTIRIRIQGLYRLKIMFRIFLYNILNIYIFLNIHISPDKAYARDNIANVECKCFLQTFLKVKVNY